MIRVSSLLRLLLVFLLPACALDARPQAQVSPAATAYQNGLWFDGNQFVRRTAYVVGDRLTFRKPTRIARSVDLAGGFVVPPFGDAHTHMFDGTFMLREHVGKFLDDGVFYAKVLTNFTTGAARSRPYLQRPDTVDAVFANAGFTSRHSHPADVYEALALRLYGTRNTDRESLARISASRKAEGNAYFDVNSVDDFRKAWPRFLAGRPDFVKIYLRNADRFGTGWGTEPLSGCGGGTDPALVPVIVAAAHQAGLRVSAATVTAADFSIAVQGGVDDIAQMPYFAPSCGADGPERYALDPRMVQLAAERRVSVTVSRFGSPAGSAEARSRERNLRLLHRLGVPVLIGSDVFGETPRQTALQLSETGIFSNRTLLKIWSETTPMAIFPNRRIGLLAEGYEASFLVLDANPLADFKAVQRIRLRVKQGLHLGAPPQLETSAPGNS